MEGELMSQDTQAACRRQANDRQSLYKEGQHRDFSPVQPVLDFCSSEQKDDR